MQITFEEGPQLPPAANISHVTCKGQSDHSMVRLCCSELHSVGFFHHLTVCSMEIAEACAMGVVEPGKFWARSVVDFGGLSTTF